MIRNGLTSAFGPLVLDIDTNDYPWRHLICECGAEQVICQTCWDQLLEPARRIIRYWLRDVFGMETGVFDVFSGRRGFHTWCYAPRVLQWTRDQRTAFLKRITLEQVLALDDDHTLACEQLLRTYTSAGADLDRQQLFERYYPRFDAAVTRDASHLKGMPLSLHHSTEYLRTPLPPLDCGNVFTLAHNRVGPYKISADSARVLTESIVRLAFGNN